MSSDPRVVPNIMIEFDSLTERFAMNNRNVKLKDKFQYFLKTARNKRCNIDSATLPTIALDLACAELSIGFPIDEAIGYSTLGAAKYTDAKWQLAKLLGLKQTTSVKSLGVIFGIPTIVPACDQVMEAITDGDDFGPDEINHPFFVLAVFMGTCEAASLTLEKDKMVKMGGGDRTVKKFIAKIRKSVDFEPITKKYSKPKTAVKMKVQDPIESSTSNQENKENSPVVNKKSRWARVEKKKARPTTGINMMTEPGSFIKSARYSKYLAWSQPLIDKLIKEIEEEGLDSP
jgi:hypothetical protein